MTSYEQMQSLKRKANAALSSALYDLHVQKCEHASQAIRTKLFRVRQLIVGGESAIASDYWQNRFAPRT